MGRHRTIDREQILDAAERIVTSQGAAGLTIDAVAKAVGITKGGVQYSFTTKDALIGAMFARWTSAYDETLRAIAGPNPDAPTFVAAHIQSNLQSDDPSHAKAASMMAALLQTPEHLGSTRAWYRSCIAGLDLSTDTGRRARLAFLAAEGAFLLRFFGLMDMDRQEWEDIFRDIGAANGQ